MINLNVMINLNDFINEYVNDPENPETNYRLGLVYESLGQTASAVTYFLRTAERTDIKEWSYECLIRMHYAFVNQGNRHVTATAMLNRAMILLPKRPEAYYIMSRYFERHKEFHTSLTWAELGLQFCDFNLPSLRGNVDYPGKYGLIFQKAVSSWWWGLRQESRDLFQHLANDYRDVMDETHLDSVQSNLSNIGCGGEYTRQYTAKMYPDLKFKFKDSEKIEFNFSQYYQDLFVLAVYDGKQNGTYLEIGAGPSFGKNNTALLERNYNWTGIGIEYNSELAEYHKKDRKNKVLCENALFSDYSKILSEIAVDGVVDFLQVDCEPPKVTYEIMTKIPFDKYKFGIITYEHDYYADVSRSYRTKSREFLSNLGYKLVIADITVDSNGKYPSEDWWYNPEIISEETIKKFLSNSDSSSDPKKYLFREEFDWGLLSKNGQNEVFERENFKEDTYQRFFSVNEGDIVFDIGASVGPFTYKIANNKPKKVYCFEPHEKLFPVLEKNVSNLGIDVVCTNKAISYSDTNFFTNGLWDEFGVPENMFSTETILTESVTFKGFIENNNIDHIDFIKTDCEGSEYDIFNDENYNWILKNVRKVAGEFHLATDDQRTKFLHFRDTYLKNLKFWILDMSNNDITDQVYDDDFVNRINAIQLYIDNRKKWQATQWPTLEITTNIAEKGCVVDCAFCPQRTLEKTYKSDMRRLTLDQFKQIINKLPKQVRITFAGFTEPWLNKDATSMLLYAYEQGHPVSGFTTGVGMKPEDVYRLKDVKFDGGPNGGFCLHLPDQDRIAKHPINANFIKVIEAFKEVGPSIQNFYVMCMSDEVHESVRHLFPTAHVPEFWSRAGNLLTEVGVKPDLAKVLGRVKSIYHGDQEMTCNQPEDLYHNVLLPNGDVSLCCQDYSLKHILGNLFTQEYDDILPKTQSCFDLCKLCENGVAPK